MLSVSTCSPSLTIFFKSLNGIYTMSLSSDTFNTSFLVVVKLYSLTVSGWSLKLSLESVSAILYVQPSSKPGTVIDELFSILGVFPVIT